MTAPIDPCPHPTASRIRRVGQEECGACGAKREPSAKAYYGWDEWRTAFRLQADAVDGLGETGGSE
jgi:hypothetical protein